MLDTLTLRFKNEKLETEYQQYQQKNQIEQIEIFTGSSICMSIPYMAILVVDQRYVEIILTAIMLVIQIWCLYTIKCTVYKPQKIIWIYEIFVLLVPVVTLTIQLLSDMSNSQIIETTAILLMLALVLPLTGNLLLGTIQYFFIICTSIFLLYQVIGRSTQLIIIFWSSIFKFVLRYKQFRSNKYLFVKSLTNDSIYDILRSTTKEDLIIFKYDEDNRKYDLIFEKITIDSQFKLLPFLQKFKLQNNISLCDYIWKFQTTMKDQKTEEIFLTGCYGENRVRYNINLYILNYPKQTFVIKLYQPSDKIIIQECCKNEHNIINKFTKAALKIFFQQNEYRMKQEFWNLVLAYQIRLNLVRIYRGQRCRNIQSISIDQMILNLSRLFQMKLILTNGYTINSDKKLLSILIQQILLMIHSNNRKFAVLLFEINEFCIKMSFRFRNPINFAVHIRQREDIIKLTNNLSLYEPLLEKNQIDIDLIRNLNAPFRDN